MTRWLNPAVRLISAALRSNRAAASPRVNQAVAQMDQATQQNASLAEQAAAAAAMLKEQAERMEGLVGRFRLDRAPAVARLEA